MRVTAIWLIKEAVCENTACEPNGLRIDFGARRMEEQKGLGEGGGVRGGGKGGEGTKSGHEVQM